MSNFNTPAKSLYKEIVDREIKRKTAQGKLLKKLRKRPIWYTFGKLEKKKRTWNYNNNSLFAR